MRVSLARLARIRAAGRINGPGGRSRNSYQSSVQFQVQALSTSSHAAETSTSTSTSPSNSSNAASRPSSFNSINPEEIQHFSGLSSQWWDQQGEFGLLHRMNPSRVEYIRRKVALESNEEPPWTFEKRFEHKALAATRGTGRWLEGKKCLDIGCGGGLLSESLARLGGHVTGVDASESNIAIATLHASQDPLLPFQTASVASSSSSSSSSSHSAGTSRTSYLSGSLQYRHSTAETLRDAGEQYDIVCSMEVVEHVEQPGEFMKCLGDLVKPGGHLILSTISRTVLSRLLTITLAEDVLRLVTPGTHTHSKFIKPDEMRRFVFAEMGGFDVWEQNNDASDVRLDEVGSTQGIIYDPLAGQWKLWSATEGTWSKALGEECNYMFHARKRRER
ncbi:S-adenosyl-L-methionine-dependent methyltransferase [Kockovaella imperatae]|uniref:Ubiquinone biosynthesis O-methyltransferase, mitochondrial n=1 Tax=Kockovaella imperatae TaxID=4999 RepID=A0A1Y1U8J7_9TREE|nr:S-adenosyl-L-methionine-dependent methyltransferase [Kockovaella imperatae]ORX33864.1 S-adenosyl-L-methionine-dependent methyltransferase [Kockovaella imperatae]